MSPKSRQDCYTISPVLHYDLAKILPKPCQGCTMISSKSCQNLAKVALRFRQNLAKISPQLQYDVPKTGRIAIQSRHSCSTMSPRLAGLLYDLATVALLCPIESPDLRSRHSFTTMSKRPRENYILSSCVFFAAWLFTTTLLATNFLLHQIKDKINITSSY